MNKIVEKAAKVYFKVAGSVQKHSPEICILAGIASGIAATVLACRASTKLEDVLAETREKLEQVAAALVNPDIPDETYSEEDAKKDRLIYKAKCGVNVLKLYGPALALGVLSITGILVGSNILHKRNLALAAAYATLDNTFRDYRGRVLEKVGEEAEKELRYGVEERLIERKVTGADGEETVVQEKVKGIAGEPSAYAKFFDEKSRYWEKDPEYNLMFLRSQQAQMNNILRLKGRVFLNEVYEALDIPTTREGQIVGWVYDPTNGHGDNMIDFGIYNTYRFNDANRDFVNGNERSILLDFNVDGNIWKDMKGRRYIPSRGAWADDPNA